MELRHLRYFIAVAEELNFTRAAERLHTSQPSLSQQIRDIEDEVGTLLFTRTRRKVELTEAGKVFLTEARLTQAQAERAVTRARQVGLRQGEKITIGFVPAAEVRVFPHVLPRLRFRFPELAVELRSLPTFEQEQRLLNGEIDVAFMRRPIHSRDINSKVVLREPLVAVLPIAHPLARHERLTAAQLSDEPFIGTDTVHAGEIHHAAEAYFAQHGLRPRIVQVATNILLNLNLVSMGLGYGILPAYVSALTNPAICTRPLADSTLEIELLMAWRAGARSAQLDELLALAAQDQIP